MNNLRDKIWISVIGGHRPSKNALDNAFRVGELIARNDAVLVCGGLGGVMSAAAKGAKSQDGLTIGILPNSSRNDANRYIDIPIITGLGIARNLLVVRNGDVAIAIDGNWGTLSEIALAKNLGKIVITLDSYEIDGLIFANSPEEAVKLAIENVK
ncbi:TIGR00725 family protein [bacterium]|nr:TIGR00725 family protein [bacterium]